ncbi:Similar to Poly(A) RNA polymerase cid14; acc. no. Q9UTN3 [Pyronema omphalodes CBS 100304]|uniref:Similar to Poly(A) RNA polymerase cid14 acc. no. Q9UTN3 n=1 Tax=Pyronema omphalodes (strain CBS 100304) TaxID=1076935 RepID=U4KXT0_PYROM|nr:Similar to Poly(A) RNA polymerase cid14; acc. no. Q9UTN3 [Pyronema omphalodes CBS 100304]
MVKPKKKSGPVDTARKGGGSNEQLFGTSQRQKPEAGPSRQKDARPAEPLAPGSPPKKSPQTRTARDPEIASSFEVATLRTFETNSKPYNIPPRDRTAHTGRSYVPAYSEPLDMNIAGITVDKSNGEWAPRKDVPLLPREKPSFIVQPTNTLSEQKHHSFNSYLGADLLNYESDIIGPPGTGSNENTTHGPGHAPPPFQMQRHQSSGSIVEYQQFIDPFRTQDSDPKPPLHHSESVPTIDTYQHPSWLLLRVKGQNLWDKESHLDILADPAIAIQSKITAGYTEHQLPPQKQYSKSSQAIFENGMRVAEGRGFMNTDYTGVVLPLLDEFQPIRNHQISAPWLRSARNACNPRREGTDQLSDEIYDFIDYMSRDESEIRVRRDFTQKVTKAMSDFFRERSMKVEIGAFGSDVSGLGLPTSDIDLMISDRTFRHMSNPYTVKEKKTKILLDLEKYFIDNCICDDNNSTVRCDAKIPILEIQDKETGLEVDISFEEDHSGPTITQVKGWIERYTRGLMIPLTLLLKHSLNMRKLGLGAATMPYQGGMGSYILTCMVAVFLEVEYRHLQPKWILAGEKINIGKIYTAMMYFWGVRFDYETKAIRVNPPEIVNKNLSIAPWTFEVQSPFSGISENIASNCFATRHIKATLGYFWYQLHEGIQDHNDRSRGPGFAESNRLGILGRILGGNYDSYTYQRSRIIRAGLSLHTETDTTHENEGPESHPKSWMKNTANHSHFPPLTLELSRDSREKYNPRATARSLYHMSGKLNS